MKRWMAAVAIATIPLMAAPQLLAAEEGTDEAKAKVDWFGSLRLRPEYNDNLSDMFAGNDDANGYVGYRANLGAKVGLDKDVTLVFDAQLLGRWGEDQQVQRGSSTQSALTSSLGLFNAYADAHHIGGQPFSLRAGRQPLVFGDEWILGDSDFYGGTAWDGLRGDFDHKLGTVSLFWAKVAAVDSPETISSIPFRGGDDELYGAWTTWKLATIHNLDVAVLYGFDHRTLVATGGPAFTDRRWTATARYHFGKETGGFANANVAYQWGTTAIPTSTTPISIRGAYAWEATGGYVWMKDSRPFKLWGRLASFTGDKAGTAASETYRDIAMDQHTRYGYLDFWEGMWGFQPYIGGAPGFQTLQLGFECLLPSGFRVTGIAQQDETQRAASPNSGNRDLGQEYALVAGYDYGKNVSIELAFAQIYPGQAFRFVAPFFGSDTARRIYVNTIVRF